jgi:AcrR family transcriptional regulator
LNSDVQYCVKMSKADVPAVSRIHDAAIRLFAENGGQEVSVSDLAKAAGIARGTIYNNIDRPEALFDEVAAKIAHEMHARIAASMNDIDDPAVRLSTGMRMFVRRTHDEPHWGRFIVRFGGNDDTLRRMMDAPPAVDIGRGIASRRFDVRASQLPSVVGMVGGVALAAMHAVLAGRQTWRVAGADASELVLRALGVPNVEARAIAQAPLAPLAPVDHGATPRKRRTSP